MYSDTDLVAKSLLIIEHFIFVCFNPEQLAKIKIEDDGSYVQVSEVNVNTIVPRV